MSSNLLTVLLLASACLSIIVTIVLCRDVITSSSEPYHAARPKSSLSLYFSDPSAGNNVTSTDERLLTSSNSTSSSSSSSPASARKDSSPQQMATCENETSPRGSIRDDRTTTPSQANSHRKFSHSHSVGKGKSGSGDEEPEVFLPCGRQTPGHLSRLRQQRRPQRNRRPRRNRRHRRQKRVVGGNDARRKQFPWMAMLLVHGVFRCGGSIIHHRYILTAAHCLRESGKNKGKLRFVAAADLEVIAGKHKFPVMSSHFKGEQRASVDEVIPHPEYDDTKDIAKHNDLALIVLRKPLRWTATVSQICLPSSRDHFPHVATFAGWGSIQPRDRIMWAPSPPQVLQRLSVSVRVRDDCLNMTSSYYYVTHMTQEQLCAVASPPGNSGTCNGDSGGPLFSSTRRRHKGAGGGLHVQHGLLSWGFCDVRPGAPSFFTRLLPHTRWILTVMKARGISPPIRHAAFKHRKIHRSRS